MDLSRYGIGYRRLTRTRRTPHGMAGFGVVGFVKFVDCYYLLLVTQRSVLIFPCCSHVCTCVHMSQKSCTLYDTPTTKTQPHTRARLSYVHQAGSGPPGVQPHLRRQGHRALPHQAPRRRGLPGRRGDAVADLVRVGFLHILNWESPYLPHTAPYPCIHKYAHVHI